MSKLNFRLVKIAAAALACLLALVVVASSAAQDLPAGNGVEIARNRCLTCHEADLIVSQRLARAGWVREVEKMVRWGAIVTDAEKEPLVDYFAARFTPRPATSSATDEERGKQIFAQKCLVCHEADLTEQQRLARAGWVREVEKMVRWGATVSDAEKEPLVDYLSGHYAPRK